MIAEIKSLLSVACVVLFLATLPGLSVVQAQEKPLVIGKMVVRQELLELSEQLLDSGDPAFHNRVLKTPSPYLVFVPKLVEVDSDGVERLVSFKLPDSAVLKIVADRMKPKGNLIMGGKRVLILEKSGKLTMGDVIPITIRDVSYKVIISDISDKTYTIKLNESERIVSIRGKQGRGRIAFDKP